MDKTVTETSNTGMWVVSITTAVVTIFFGLLALLWPQLTAATLAYLFGIFILIHGIARLIAGLMGMRTQKTWWLTSLLGVVGLGAGIFVLNNINLALATFILLIGFVLIAQGVLGVIIAATDTESTSNKILPWIIGLAGIIAGVYILMQPVAGGTAFVWILGLYAVIVGVLELLDALQTRSSVSSPST